jgi:hypothetical protein
MYRKGFSRLLGKKGESLVLVIAMMFFFIIICLSVSAAALSSSRGVHAQTENNRIKVIENSIHKNIMYSLQTDDGLGRQLAQAFYDSYKSGGSLSEITLDVDINGINITDYFDSIIRRKFTVEEIKLTFTNINVTEHPAIAALYEIQDIERTCSLSVGVCTLPKPPNPCDESESACVFGCFPVHAPNPCPACPDDCPDKDHDCTVGGDWDDCYDYCYEHHFCLITCPPVDCPLAHVCDEDYCDDPCLEVHICDAYCPLPDCPLDTHDCTVGDASLGDCYDPCPLAIHDCIGPCDIKCIAPHHVCADNPGDCEIILFSSSHQCDGEGHFNVNPRCNFDISNPASLCAPFYCDPLYNPVYHPSSSYPFCGPSCTCNNVCERCYNPAFPRGCSGGQGVAIFNTGIYPDTAPPGTIIIGSTGGKYIRTDKVFEFTTPRTPRTYSISASMIVTIQIRVDAGLRGDRVITSRAVYDYAGGEMSDCMRYIPASALLPLDYNHRECLGILSFSGNGDKLDDANYNCCMKRGIFNTLDRNSNPVMNFKCNTPDTTPNHRCFLSPSSGNCNFAVGTWRLEKYENIESLG